MLKAENLISYIFLLHLWQYVKTLKIGIKNGLAV